MRHEVKAAICAAMLAAGVPGSGQADAGKAEADAGYQLPGPKEPHRRPVPRPSPERDFSAIMAAIVAAATEPDTQSAEPPASPGRAAT